MDKALRLDCYPPDEEWLARLDEWIKRQPGEVLSRAAAVRRIVEERLERDEARAAKRAAR